MIALPALLLTLAACSSNNNKNANAGGSSNPVPQTGVNPGAATPIGASGVRASSPAAGGSSSTIGTAVASPGALAAAGAQTITLTTTDSNAAGDNSKYSETSLTAKANQDIALTLTNKGQAIHNWHLLNATDANGKDIKTDLLNAGQSGTIVFKLSKPGTYNFQCDVHPTTMKGTLTIQ